jgi:hypothetical protein
MEIVWRGFTPFKMPLAALICGDCGSTFYLGMKQDPCWKMLSEINAAFGSAFQERAKNRVTRP